MPNLYTGRTQPALRRTAALCAVLVLVLLGVLTLQIVATGRAHPDGLSDVAIVLGAVVYGDKPSPVFKERIKHGIALYKASGWTDCFSPEALVTNPK